MINDDAGTTNLNAIARDGTLLVALIANAVCVHIDVGHFYRIQ